MFPAGSGRRTCILDKLVEVGQVIDRVILSQVDRQVSQCVEDRHVELVVLFWTEGPRPKFGNQGRAVAIGG